MNIIIIDDEEYALADLREIVERVCCQSCIYCFDSSQEALEKLKNFSADVVFTDIQMPGMDGLEFSKQAKMYCPNLNIVFVTAYTHYALESYEIPASGYLLKPVTEGAVVKALKELRYPIGREQKRVYVQTFGNFEIFVDQIPLHFKRAKAKEVLAYLVDRRGATATVAEISAVLFEDRPYDRSLQKQMQVFIADMLSTLKQVGAEGMIRRNYNSISVNPEYFSCDYYDFLCFDVGVLGNYYGEYMTNYSWAERSVGLLQRKNKRLK